MTLPARQVVRWSMLALVIIFGVAIGGSLYAMRYPSESDVDSAFERYAAGSGTDRAETLKSLFRNLQGPDTKEEGAVFFYALHKLETEYLRDHDELVGGVIATALSDTACCEVANGFCDTYERLLHDPVFFAYFRANTEMRRAFRVCNGANFSAAEVDALVNGEVANMEEFDAQFRVRAAKSSPEADVSESKD